MSLRDERAAERPAYKDQSFERKSLLRRLGRRLLNFAPEADTLPGAENTIYEIHSDTEEGRSYLVTDFRRGAEVNMDEIQEAMRNGRVDMLISTDTIGNKEAPTYVQALVVSQFDSSSVEPIFVNYAFNRESDGELKIISHSVVDSLPRGRFQIGDPRRSTGDETMDTVLLVGEAEELPRLVSTFDIPDPRKKAIRDLCNEVYDALGK